MPDTVPVGVSNDKLGSLITTDIGVLLDGVDPADAYEVLDPVLNNTIGYNKSAQDIATILTRGIYGIEGLCDWLDLLVTNHGIDSTLLEPRVARLCDALILWYAFTDIFLRLKCCELICLTWLSGAVPQAQDSLSHVTSKTSSGTPTFVADGPQTTLTKPKIAKKTQLCSGIQLDVPPDNSPFGSYPFLRHLTEDLPWEVKISRKGIWIFSDDCERLISRTISSATNPIPCYPCSMLSAHHSLDSIQRTIQFGSHKNAALRYHPPSQLVATIRQKNTEINTLKLTALNQARSITRSISAMSNKNRLLMAIASHNIPRVHAILSTAQRNGVGILGMLEKINKAISGVYHPRSYEEGDYHRIMLFSALGGGRLASIAQHSCHLPSPRTVYRRLQVNPIHSSPAYPTESEMSLNLSTMFHVDSSDSEAFTSSLPLGPFSICIDELKLEERLRWDSSTNMILGVCREHSHLVSLNFQSMSDADVLLEALTEQNPEKQVHLATEVR